MHFISFQALVLRGSAKFHFAGLLSRKAIASPSPILLGFPVWCKLSIQFALKARSKGPDLLFKIQIQPVNH